MKFRWLVVAYTAVVFGGALFSADSAHARHLPPIQKRWGHCADQPYRFSLQKLLFGTKPQPNGCAPPVFVDGEYVGQDPDVNIRFQLFRDPDTSYATRY